MKMFFTNYKMFVLFLLIAFQSCKKDNLDVLDPNDLENEVLTNAPFGAVFFAQTHVRQPEENDFKLVSSKEALIKVNMISNTGENAPVVKAILTLNGTSETLILSGPSTLSEPIDLRPGFIEHKFGNSFTAIIPKQWMQPGLTVEIQAGDESINFDSLKFGAPNKIIMNMFDAHFFASTPGDYPMGWKEEIQSKLPVSEIELRRLPNIIFSELTIPPRADVSAPAARVSSKEGYQTITGSSFDGEQGAAAQWNGALKAASGTKGRYALFYVNIYGVPSGGQAGGFGGVGNGKSLGIFNHELGHALSLPHWGNNKDYPYRGDMFGISAPEVFNDVHVGPTWAFDLDKNVFIPPTVQANAVGGDLGTYKKDPMQGGGTGDQEEGFLIRHFSDYSINKIQNFLEEHIVIQNEDSGVFSSWDATTKTYTNNMDNNGVQFPLEKDTQVISIMAGVSAVTPQATILYPPIGPYQSGIIDLFDPAIEADRSKAASIYCPNGGCDVSLKIVQNGQTRIVMLPIAMDAGADPLKSNSFKTRAVNLRATDGEVTMVELLGTPDAEINGIPSSPEVLYSWSNQ